MLELVSATLLLLPGAATPLLTPELASRTVQDDLQELVDQLVQLGDDADPGLIGKIADLGGRPAALALVEVYGSFGSVYMKREVVRALPRFSEVAEAQQPALQHLLNVATESPKRELRLAAVEAVNRFQEFGPQFLALIVDSAAMGDVRIRALELHLDRATDDDLKWYEGLFEPIEVEKASKSKKRSRDRSSKDSGEEGVGARLERLRVVAFKYLSSRTKSKRLEDLFEHDPNPEIQVAALRALHAQEGADVRSLAKKILTGVSRKPKHRIEAARILAAVEGPRIVDEFIDLAKKKEVTPEALRRALADEIAALDDEKVDRKVEKLIGKGKTHQRTFALRACRNSENPKVIKKLKLGIKERDEAVWQVALEVVAERKLEGVEDELERQLKKAKGPNKILRLVSALDQLRADDAEWLERLKVYTSVEDGNLRNAALTRLAIRGGAQHMEILVAALSDSNWSTRLAALKGLEAVRTTDCVGPIIARMEQEEGRLLLEFSDALFRLTGQPFGVRRAAWKQWWDREADGFELISASELSRLREEEELRRLKEVTQIAEFFGIRIQSHRVIFIVDISGSMAETLRGRYKGQPGETRIDVTKVELASAIRGLDAAALFNIITFSSSPRALLEGVAQSNQETHDTIDDFIERLGVGGGTNLFGALELAFQDPDADTIVIMSDGEPTVGSVTDPHAIREEVASWNENRDLTLHAVSVGGSLDVLRWLAEDHGGTYVEFN